MVSYGTTGWGYFEQGSDQLQEIMELGEKLNKAIGCPIHYPAFGKRLFECTHGIVFPVYVVQGNSQDTLRELHSGYLAKQMQ